MFLINVSTLYSLVLFEISSCKQMTSSIKDTIVSELHRSARKNFRRRHVVIKGLNDSFQIDLVEMIPYHKINRNFKYILVVINIFSKFVWAIPLKNKTGKEVTAAMESILRKLKIPPRNIQSDLGKEFYNKNFQELMQKYNINHYSTYSNLKASIVERVNRTLKNFLWKQFSLQGSYQWINVLQSIVNKYNNRVHRTTHFKPIDVNEKNEKQIFNTAYNRLKCMDPRKAKFGVGDHVRVSKYREAFAKGYTPNWSTEVFKVFKIQYTEPRTFILQDSHNELIKGGFYEYEMQRVKYPDAHLVEKILRTKGAKVLVKWLGFDSTHNSWIPKKDVY